MIYAYLVDGSSSNKSVVSECYHWMTNLPGFIPTIYAPLSGPFGMYRTAKIVAAVMAEADFNSTIFVIGSGAGAAVASEAVERCGRWVRFLAKIAPKKALLCRLEADTWVSKSGVIAVDDENCQLSNSSRFAKVAGDCESVIDARTVAGIHALEVLKKMVLDKPTNL